MQLDIPFEQESEFGNSSLLNLNSLEFSLDYLTRLCQILKRQVARCAKIREAVDVDPDSLSENINLLAEIKNDISTVSNAIDDVIVTSSNTENISSVAGSIENVNAVADDLENIDAVNDNKTNIDTVAGSIANVNTVADSISNVNSVAGNISNINAVKNNETNINAVNSNKTNIDTVAGSIANINTTAGSIANVNTVAGSIQDINNVADDLTNINLVAGDLSNIDSASVYADNANVWAEGTDADVQELGGVHSAKGWAEVAASGQIQSDWSQSDNTQKDFIKNKPTIPAAQIQSDWSQSDNTALDYIKNKPTIPVATDVKINNTSIISGGVADIVTNSAYDASSNKIATMDDLPSTSGLANTELSNLTTTGKNVIGGIWKPKFSVLSMTNGVNSFTMDLSSYLPNDNQAYEVFVFIIATRNSANARFAIGTVENPVTNHSRGNGNFQLYGEVINNSTKCCISGILPVGVGTNPKRTIYGQVADAQLLGLTAYLYGYRGLGTNL